MSDATTLSPEMLAAIELAAQSVVTAPAPATNVPEDVQTCSFGGATAKRTIWPAKTQKNGVPSKGESIAFTTKGPDGKFLDLTFEELSVGQQAVFLAWIGRG
jgi:hypothetical protein